MSSTLRIKGSHSSARVHVKYDDGGEPKPNKNLPFPAEIRNMILPYVLRTNNRIRPTKNDHGDSIPPRNANALALFSVSKTVRNEAIPWFFRDKVIYLGGPHHAAKWLDQIGEYARSHLSALYVDGKTTRLQRYSVSIGSAFNDLGSLRQLTMTASLQVDLPTMLSSLHDLEFLYISARVPTQMLNQTDYDEKVEAIRKGLKKLMREDCKEKMRLFLQYD